jgi:hypothetical protein
MHHLSLSIEGANGRGAQRKNTVRTVDVRRCPLSDLYMREGALPAKVGSLLIVIGRDLNRIAYLERRLVFCRTRDVWRLQYNEVRCSMRRVLGTYSPSVICSI